MTAGWIVGSVPWGGGFSPADIAGMVAWYKADAITGLADNDPVSTWVDSSGNGHDATQSNANHKPIYRTNILNGLPAVRFDGAFVDGDRLDVSAFTLGTKFAAFAVVIIRGTTSGSRYIWEQSIDTDQRCYLWKHSDGRLFFGYHDGTAFRDYTKTWSPSVDTPYIVDGGTGATNNTVGISGTSDTTTARTGYPTSASRSAQIGRSPGTGNEFSGDICELILYNVDLASGDRTSIREYLSSKWAVTL